MALFGSDKRSLWGYIGERPSGPQINEPWVVKKSVRKQGGNPLTRRFLSVAGTDIGEYPGSSELSASTQHHLRVLNLPNQQASVRQGREQHLQSPCLSSKNGNMSSLSESKSFPLLLRNGKMLGL
ncbi:hypothetical protein Nepgr_020997 [Nepenthes gracilis]|uniref:Uncharacterized protein n=1 Tax=Nepenthes gracilis TaxID=150966 RepID=A0AAD3XWY0_NEPGR|nr:hypothetical protein Nepgr_020997 [Nepenthes gracilis]